MLVGGQDVMCIDALWRKMVTVSVLLSLTSILGTTVALGEVTEGQRNTLPLTERREIGRQGWWESIVNNSYYAALISQN